MKYAKDGRFEDPELEREWNKMIELARSTGSHFYPYKKPK